jgi:hypothetical protein
MKQEFIINLNHVVGLDHSSDILSIRFKHTHIIRFFGLLKKYLKILDHRCLWVWAQLKLSLLIVFTYFTYSHFQIFKYLKILLFEHLQKIRVFRMSLLWARWKFRFTCWAKKMKNHIQVQPWLDYYIWILMTHSKDSQIHIFNFFLMICFTFHYFFSCQIK